MEKEQTQTNEVVEEKVATEVVEESSTVEGTQQNEVETPDFDEKNETQEDKTKDKPKQDQKTNAEYAQKRRETEQVEKQKKQLEYQAELRGIRKALKDTNPFTEETMTTDDDVEFYLTQVEMEKQGLDPNSLKDYKAFQVKKKEETTKQTTKEEFYKKDSQEFLNKFPTVDIEALFKDERFGKFSKGKIGNIPLAEIYSDYQEFTNEIDTKAKEKAEKRIAKIQSSPGSMKSDNNDTKAEALYTWEQLQNLSQKDMVKNWVKVEKSYKEALKEKRKA